VNVTRRPVDELVPQIDTLVIAGFAGRDQDSVQAHIDELVAEGIPAPDEVPSFYSVPVDRLTTDPTIAVTSTDSSGEVEPVLLFVDGDVWLTVGSDHTARDVERASIEESKRACGKVLGSHAWRYAEVRERADDVRLSSEVEVDGTWLAYQSGSMAQLLPPETTIAKYEASSGQQVREGVALFLGTVPLLTHGFVYGGGFRAVLEDSGTGDSLRVEYAVNAPKTAEVR
jgi:hypothetical protein